MKYINYITLVLLFATVLIAWLKPVKEVNNEHYTKEMNEVMQAYEAGKTIEYYYKICDSDMRRNKPECRLTKTEILHKTFGTKPVDHIDTVFVPVHDTIYINTSREACVKKCTDNNTSKSVIDFCIKEECNKL